MGNFSKIIGISLVVGLVYLAVKSISKGDFFSAGAHSKLESIIEKGKEEGKKLFGSTSESEESAPPSKGDKESQVRELQGRGYILLPSVADVVEKVSKGVVNISTTRVERQPNPFYWFFGPGPFRREEEEFFRRFFGEPERSIPSRSLGSGFIVSPDGYIVTNSHVVRGAQDIKVTMWDGKVFDAKIIGIDEATDIAMLKIDAKGLPFLEFGDSEKLRVGDWVIAIGNPFGLGHTVTLGIVSAKGRALGITRYEDFIQTDAAINPGNSGGPLIDLEGKVVGINTAILNPSGAAVNAGIGFAIPASLASKIVDSLAKRGKVERAWLGVYIQEVSPEIARAMGLKEPMGALVTEVMKNSPAEKAGIKRGDIIIEFDGKPVKSSRELPIMVSLSPIGKKVYLKVIRESKEIKFEITLAPMPEEQQIRSQAPSEQSEEQEQGEIYLKSFGIRIRDSEKGPQVVSVDPGTPGQFANVAPGDLIVEVNRKEVKTAKEVAQIVGDQKSVLLLINRGGRYIYVVIKTG